MGLLGKIIKVHGYEGAVLFLPEDDITEEIKEQEWVFIEVDKKPVPFFISSAKEHTSGKLVIKFDSYNSRDVMKEFTGCRVFSGQEQDDRKLQVTPHLILAGYKVYDREDDYLGLIDKVLSLPMQYMLVLMTDEDRELLIPLNESWIVEINKSEKVIKLDLPEGILNLNEE